MNDYEIRVSFKTGQYDFFLFCLDMFAVHLRILNSEISTINWQSSGKLHYFKFKVIINL